MGADSLKPGEAVTVQQDLAGVGDAQLVAMIAFFKFMEEYPEYNGFFRRRESVADNLYPPRDEKLDAAMKDER